jgi:hypothetical protein
LRAFRKGKRVINEKLFGKKKTTRNWEIQFIGEKNDKNLRKHLFENKKFQDLISQELVAGFYQNFQKDSLQYSHPVNMLLTLSLFSKNYL